MVQELLKEDKYDELLAGFEGWEKAHWAATELLKLKEAEETSKIFNGLEKGKVKEQVKKGSHDSVPAGEQRSIKLK